MGHGTRWECGDVEIPLGLETISGEYERERR